MTNAGGGTHAHGLTIGGDLTVTGSFNMISAGSDYCDVLFGGSTAQTISGVGTVQFHSATLTNSAAAVNILTNAAASVNVVLNNGSLLTVTSPATLTITNNLNIHNAANASTTAGINGTGAIKATGLNVGDNALTPSGTYIHTLNFSGVNLNLSGNLNLNTYRGFSNALVDNATLNFATGIISVGGTVSTVNAGGGNVAILNMATGAQTGTLNVGGGTAAFVISGNGTSTITLNGTGTTVNYTRGNTQTIYAAGANYPYFNLITSGGAGTKTLGNSIIANGKITIGTGTTLASGNFAINAKGDWENNNAFTAGTWNQQLWLHLAVRLFRASLQAPVRLPLII